MKTSAKNQECIFIFITIVIVLITNLTGFADITPVNDRTSEVRDAIVAAVPGVNNAANVTAAHLAAITSLNLRGKGISVLKTNDFSGLTALSSLNLYNNQLSNLPEGIFEGLTSLIMIRLSRNAIDPLPFTVSLEKVAEGEFKAIAPAGALFDIVLPITVTNGIVAGGLTTLTIPHGSVESSPLTVTRTVGTTAHVTVNIGTLPSLPRNHFGYALVKSDTLPLTIISGTNTAPVFTEGASTTRSIAENTTTGQNIGSAVSATDAENDTLTYTLSGTDASAFNIGSATGQLKTKSSFDYETKNTYTVTITVSDGSLTDTIMVTINITDVHEVVAPPPNSAPVFSEGSSTTRSIAENTVTGQNIGAAVAATDADEHQLTYTISGTDAASFSIVSASGQLQNRAALDYEIKTSYAVTITVSDGSLTDSIAVTINVTDVDETIIGPRYVPVVDRTPEVRDAIVAAVPNVSNAVEVTKAHVAAIRDLNLRNLGIIALKTGDFSGMTALTSLNLFNNQLSSLPSDIFEGLTSLNTVRLGQSVADPLPFTVSLEKVGAGAFKAVAPAGALFEIVLPITVTNGSVMGGAATVTIPHGSMESGILRVTRTAGTTAHVTVDIGKLPSLPRNHYGYALLKSDNLPLVIVRGPNTAPVFSDGTTATRSVAEDTAIGVNIGAPVSATDADGDTLTYSFSGIDASIFSINSSTGQLQTRAILDYETKASYSVTVTASDSYGGSDSITVTINVTDIDENRSPVFTEGNSASRTIAENTGSGQHIGSAVSATDADNDTLTYILNGTDAASFDVDSTSGQLETKAALDYETKASYSVTVAVSDGNGGSDSITVTINVTDVHDNRAPVFTEDASTTRTIGENTETGSNIGDAVSATDQDAKDTLTYTLSGTDAAAFDIDSTTGQIKTKASLDYETKNTYSVTLTVSDGLASDTIAVTINVTNIDENRAPIFTEGSRTTRTVAKNATASTNIGDPVAATDADGDTLIYSLGGTDSVSFDINSTTGQIKTKAVLDYETKNTYSVTLTVSDGLAIDTIAVTIKVTDIDENRMPTFTEGANTTRTIAENTEAGSNIGDAVSATDQDANDTLTYTLSGTDAAAFDIDSTTGQIKTKASLDYETKSNYSVTLTVSDGLATDTTTVTINVTNIDDNRAPMFTEGNSATRTVAENITAGTKIGNAITATDPDNDTLTYSFAGQDASLFRINTKNGQLSTNVVLDYEAKSVYVVSVYVSDGKLTAIIAVTINITDTVDNRAPVFTEGVSTTRTIGENTEAGSNIGNAVSATDQDANDTLTYTLGGTDAAAFRIDGTTGQIKTKAALDYETKNTYSVTLTVSDGLATDTIAVTINVTDIDENHPPVFSEVGIASRSVAENTGADLNIGSAVSATDQDANDTLTYTLGGTDAAAFSVDRTTGQIKTKAALDYETKNTYSVTLTVSDGLATDTIAVTINVTDIDENHPPVFSEVGIATRFVAENTGADLNIGSAVAATDADNDTLTYTLGGTDAAAFSVDRTTGQIKTKAALDYETKNTYFVTLTVSDGLATDTIAVTINVADIDENRAPVFTEGSSATRTVVENVCTNTNIGNAITATDPDNDTLKYSLGGRDARAFGIDTSTGQLRTYTALDYEAKSIYAMSVTVSDGTLTDIIAVTINITDVQESTNVLVSAINFVPVNHPRFINNPWIGGGRVKLDPAKHNRELATYYEYSLSRDLLGGLPEGFIKTIYENREHEGRLVITPYSRLAITLKDNSRLTTFFAEHEFELRDEKGQVVPTYNDYKNGKFHVDVKGMDNLIKDSIVIQPKAYLGGGLIESINKVYTLKIIHKPSKRTIFVKECITLFESSPFLLLQICAVPEGWEDADGAGEKEAALTEYYNYHPEYYHWVRRTTVAYDSFYFNEIVGKSYIEGYNQFPIRVEVHPDDPKYAHGWGGMAYGNGLKAEIDKIRETIGHQGVLREVYHLYHTEHKSAPYFGWKSWGGENAPYWFQVINADTVGGMRQRVRINQFTDYNHEVGHTFNLGHNAGASLSYTWKGYNSLCYWKILPYFYEIKGTLGKGVLRKNEQGTWVGDSQNVIILPGGFFQPLTKIKIQGGNIILPMEKIGPVKEGLVGEELGKQNGRIIAQQASQNDALYFFEPDQSGQYKLTFFYTPVNSNVYGDLVVQVHAESIEGTLENLSRNPSVKVSSRKTLVRDTVMLTAKNPITKKDDNFSLQNMTFQNGRSYAIFIHYEMTENDDKKFEESSLIFQRIEVTNNVGQIADETLPNLAPMFTDRTSTTRSHANFPNPFNPETWIPYQLAKPAEVTLTIYDMRGVVVRTIALGHKAVGVYTNRSRAIHWDGRNMFGEKVAAGVYFYTLTAGNFTATRKMLIRK